MISIRDTLPSDIPVIRDLAEQTWWAYYPSILSHAQLSYMLNKIYPEEALRKAMLENSEEFILLYDNLTPLGFASFGSQPADTPIIKLHKLYIVPEKHRKGLGRMLVEEVKKRCVARGALHLDLNVNRFNQAKYFYQKIGFRLIRLEDIPIGPFWMNDYVMRFDLKN